MQHREPLFSGDWVVRSSCLLKPAEAKRRNSLLRCWDVPWTLKAGSIAGLEPGTGKSGTRVCALSLWGCWASYHLPPQTSFWLQCAHRRKRPPQPNYEKLLSVNVQHSSISEQAPLCTNDKFSGEEQVGPPPVHAARKQGWGGVDWLTSLMGSGRSQKGIGRGQPPPYLSYFLAF